jgi:hypothetical protein
MFVIRILFGETSQTFYVLQRDSDIKAICESQTQTR